MAGRIDEFGHVDNGMFAEDYIEQLEQELKLLRPVVEAARDYANVSGDVGEGEREYRTLQQAVQASQEAKPAPAIRVCSTCRWDGRKVDLIHLRFPCVACSGMSEWVADDGQEAKPVPVVCEAQGEQDAAAGIVRFSLLWGSGMQPYQDDGEWVLYKDIKPVIDRVQDLEQELSRYEESPTCNKGHVNVLPLRLWDCPTCTEEMRAKVRDYETIGLPERTMMDELMQERNAALERAQGLDKMLSEAKDELEQDKVVFLELQDGMRFAQAAKEVVERQRDAALEREKRLREVLKALRGRERLTGDNHKLLGVPLTITELLLNEDVTIPKYSSKKILQEVFARLAEYEDALQALEGGSD